MVLATIVWVLTMLVDLPLVGKYFTDAQSYVTEYAENTNYKDEFEEMNQQLRELNENMRKDAPPNSSGLKVSSTGQPLIHSKENPFGCVYMSVLVSDYHYIQTVKLI